MTPGWGDLSPTSLRARYPPTPTPKLACVRMGLVFLMGWPLLFPILSKKMSGPFPTRPDLPWRGFLPPLGWSREGGERVRREGFG